MNMIASKLKFFCFILFWLIDATYGSPPTRKLELPLLEEQAIGSEVHNLMLDPSMDGRSGISFKLLSQQMRLGNDVVDDVTRWVALNDETGVISVAKSVDREEYCNADKNKPCVVHVKIVRQPQSDLLLIDLELNVIDINDHPPKFPLSPEIVVNVSEATSIATWINLDSFLATDEDQELNAEITYSLSRSRHFSLHSHKEDTTGEHHLELVVTNELDHEDKSSYDLTLTAHDNGSPQQQSSSVTLKVLIIDANDHPPVFDKQVYTIELQENVSPGFTVTTVHAKDEDSNSFGELRYFVPQAGNSPIARDLIDVNSLTGEVFLKQSLDREKHNNLRVIIAARDLAPGNQKKIGKTNLLIQVADVNDNAPVVHVSIIVETNGSAAFVSESSRIGTYIARVTVDDADYGANSEVSVELSTQLILTSDSEREAHAPSDFFTLEDESFIKTNVHLDRERFSHYLVTIRACDAGSPVLCSSRNLTVVVLDENDNAPVFSSSGKSIALREDTDIGTVVSSVHATDRDSQLPPAIQLTEKKLLQKSLNGVIRYELHGNEDRFAIDENSGKIRLVRPLDYESKKSWKMTATAWDKGRPRKSANITIKIDVIDINDNTPVFTSPSKQNHTVPATIQSDDVILQITALDYDSRSFSQIHYQIMSEDGTKELPQKFILDEVTGNLRLNMSNPNLKALVGSHTLLIKAQDSGAPPLSQVLHLRVKVYDVPLSVLPNFTEEPVGVKKPDVDLTVVLIASLAAAALFLVIILTLMLFRCKRTKRESRSYPCRNAETKTDHFHFGSNVTNNVTAMTSDRLIPSSHSSFNSINWKKNSDIRFTNVPNEVSSLVKSYQSKRKGSHLKESTFGPVVPSAVQNDRDSGRGDSDHDATSYEEKDSTYQVDGIPPQVSLTAQHVCGKIQNTEDVAKSRCTHLCKQYGHSDTCWMPQNGENLEAVVTQPLHLYQYIPHPDDHCEIIRSSVGLETISETQPLHSVLNTDQAYFEKEVHGYDDGSQVVLLNSDDAVYHPSSGRRSASFTQHPLSYQYNDYCLQNAPYQHYAEPEATVAALQYSISEAFHDRYEAIQPLNPTSPLSSFQSPYHHLSYQNHSNAQVHAMHHHKIPKRDSVSERLPSVDESRQTPSVPPSHGEVSMEETREIIENIDRLIDH